MFKKLISLFILIFISSLFLIYAPTDECQNLFDSKIYTFYQNQLIEKIHSDPWYQLVSQEPQNPLKESVQQFISNLQEQVTDQKMHSKRVCDLRRLVTLSDEYDDNTPSKNLVNSIILWIFSEADLSEQYQEYIVSVSPKRMDFLETQKMIDDQFKGLSSRTLHQDGFYYGNLPTVYSNQSPVAIRFSKPLTVWRKIPFVSPRINPEFYRFASLKTNHLYVNLMKRKGEEGHDSLLIEDLENKIPSFHVATFDKDSSFYWQKGETYSSPSTYLEFKEIYLNKLFDPNGNYHWPKSLNLESIKAFAAWQLDLIHQSYFDQKQILDSGERRDLIEISYLSFLDYLLQELKSPSFNITCSQGIDRGPSLLVLWLYRQKRIDEEKALALLFAPPLLHHNRSSYKSKIERFISSKARIKEKI